MAIAKGASLFEKHVGVPTGTISLNAYSANPGQIRRWLEGAQNTLEVCGEVGRRPEAAAGEVASLSALRRGVFARKSISPGEKLEATNIFLAFPPSENQLTANDLSKYTDFHAQVPIQPQAPILLPEVQKTDKHKKIYNIVQRVKEVVKNSGILPPNQVDLEISHHYGLDKFEEYGLTMLTIINREYCKKLMILLPGQQHPEQYHTSKEETFHILYGQVNTDLDGVQQTFAPGEVLTIERGVRHSFSSPTGAVIEEISSTHAGSDSYYTDPKIGQNRQRKTFITYWLD